MAMAVNMKRFTMGTNAPLSAKMDVCLIYYNWPSWLKNVKKCQTNIDFHQSKFIIENKKAIVSLIHSCILLNIFK